MPPSSRMKAGRGEGPVLPTPGMLLALDTSSTCIGYAAFRDGRLTACGSVSASSRDFLRRMDSLWMKLRRAVPMAVSVPVVMEWHHGREMAWQRRQRRGRNAAAAVTLCHGQGCVLGRLVGEGFDVRLVTDREWTRQRPKDARAREVALAHPEFFSVWAKDVGHDAADAVGIGEFYLAKVRERELMMRAGRTKGA